MGIENTEMSLHNGGLETSLWRDIYVGQFCGFVVVCLLPYDIHIKSFHLGEVYQVPSCSCCLAPPKKTTVLGLINYKKDKKAKKERQSSIVSALRAGTGSIIPRKFGLIYPEQLPQARTKANVVQLITYFTADCRHGIVEHSECTCSRSRIRPDNGSDANSSK